jgi:hypothetical protein
MAEGTSDAPDRRSLMERHAAAVARRRAAPLGSEAFQKAAEQVARIEVQIARLEEPPAEETAERAKQT